MLARGDNWVQIEARLDKSYARPYMTFKRGDKFIEWHYSDRWYNIFEIYDRDDDSLKGWYCNICRPARWSEFAISSTDLALDYLVYPDGKEMVLDEDDFAHTDMSDEDRAKALAALDELQGMVARREPPFDKLPPPQEPQFLP